MTETSFLSKLIIVAIVLAGVGCDAAPAPSDPDSAIVHDGGADACATCDPDAAEVGDGNDSFEAADELVVPPEGISAAGVLNPAGDRDYYSFVGRGGSWISVTAFGNAVGNPDLIDTVVTLYDASRTQVAENHGWFPGANADSELITRLPADGTYYILVQDRSTHAAEEPRGGPSFEYTVGVFEFADAAPAVNVEVESGDDAASALPLTAFDRSGTYNSYVLGSADHANDADVFAFDVVSGRTNVFALVLPDGSTGIGSASAPTRIWIEEASTGRVVARLDPSEYFPALLPLNTPAIQASLDPGSYLLFVESGADSEGAVDDFYAVRVFRFREGVHVEAAEASNDAVATPEVLPLAAASGIRYGNAVASLGDADTDHFSISAFADERASLTCSSRAIGSGVTGLRVTILDATGETEIASAAETVTTADARIEGVALPGAGTYLVRLTKESQDPEVAGTFVRCSVYLHR